MTKYNLTVTLFNGITLQGSTEASNPREAGKEIMDAVETGTEIIVEGPRGGFNVWLVGENPNNVFEKRLT